MTVKPRRCAAELSTTERSCTSRNGWTGTPLYQYVDFLSPHNYSGQAETIEGNIRTRDNVAGTQSAVVLEEYGAPTDPYLYEPNGDSWREGCFDPFNPYDPSLPYCTPTQVHTPSASYLIELNARAVRGSNGVKYAGGLAYMLADTTVGAAGGGRQCTSGVSDFYTGLFATGTDQYCQGTYSIDWAHGGGMAKATGFRIRTNDCYYPYGYNICQ